MEKIVNSLYKTPALDKFTVDLTEKVRQNPTKYVAYGRNREIERMVTSLLRVDKNSPCLVGEAGVGKTAIVEGFCAACLSNKVPEELQGVKVRSLLLSAIMEKGDPSALLANLYQIIEELTQTNDTNILFIDEVHTIMGTGASEKSALDAGNALKAALSRGEIKLISATTEDEFRIIEKDPAMERRMQSILVEEPDRESALYIMKKIAPRYEKLRGVTITPEALEATVDLSIRYIADKHLPDKAIDLIDEAVAHAYIKNKKTVTFKDIAWLIHLKRGIPLESILLISRGKPIDIEAELAKVVKGQSLAIKTISHKIYSKKTDMQNENRPASAFVLGTTGVGKTELGKQVARLFYGDSEAFIRIDCTEYNSKDSVQRLIGNPANNEKGQLTEQVKNRPYSLIMFDEIEKADPSVHNLLLQILDDGHLTDAYGRKIDFKQSFIYGTSNAGHQTIRDKFAISGDFSNLDSQSYKSFVANVTRDLEQIFRPEFLNRWSSMIIMNLLTEDITLEIISSKLSVLEQQWKEKQHLTIEYKDENGYENKEDFYDYLKNVGTSVINGARPLERAITDILSDPIAKQLYFFNRRENDSFVVEVVLKGLPPRSYKDGSGRTNITDMRHVDIKVKKLP